MSVPDRQDVYAGQVRGLQAIYPKADRALRHWALWSRYRNGIFPREARPVIYSLGPAANDEGWAEDPKLPKDDGQPVKPEAPRNERFEERLAVETDVLIHQDDFPAIWRRCIKAAYFYRYTPEYDFPRAAKCSHASFLMFLEAALNRVEMDAP